MPAVTREKPGRTRRSIYVSLGSAVAVVTLIGAANLEVTTRQGLNFEVSTHRLPLYLKALQFIERSEEYGQIAEEVTQHAGSDADRVLKVFDWTRRRLRQTPEGWPIVDDHILNIIIRGHAVNDQYADVFATIATYAGVPAFWSKVPLKRPPGVILSFALVEGRWRVFDVANGVVFRTRAGDLATLADIAAQPDIIPRTAGAIDVDGVPYADVVARASMPPVPDPLRAELQMPSIRLWHEMKVMAGLEAPR
jgi:hypothetical protein